MKKGDDRTTTSELGAGAGAGDGEGVGDPPFPPFWPMSIRPIGPPIDRMGVNLLPPKPSAANLAVTGILWCMSSSKPSTAVYPEADFGYYLFRGLRYFNQVVLR